MHQPLQADGGQVEDAGGEGKLHKVVRDLAGGAAGVPQHDEEVDDLEGRTHQEHEQVSH